VIASLTLQTSPLWAQTEDVEALYTRGAALRARHQDAEALDVYRHINEVSPQPRAVAQIALAEGALGRWAEAEAHLAEALSTASDPWIARTRPMLEGGLATIRSHLGDLEVVCSAPGAEVWIQGRRVAALPASRPARVVAGPVVFEVRAPHFAVTSRSTTVVAGGLARESVEIGQSTSTPPPPAPEGARPAASPGATPDVERGSTQRRLGWIGVASGGALLVGGVVMYALGAGEASTYNADPSCPGVGAPSQSPGCAGHLDTADTMEALAITGFVAGGVIAAASAVLLGTAPSAERARSSGAALACGGGPGLAGVSCRLRF
jgi:hypothetical protein